MKHLFLKLPLIFLILICSCKEEEKQLVQENPLDFVDPFIGTGFHGSQIFY